MGIKQKRKLILDLKRELFLKYQSNLKVCLIEKDDFGSQTSANSLKVLHGGLRYLQHANFKRMRESIHSRKVFQQIAPHLVKNIPFVIPTSGFTIKSKFFHFQNFTFPRRFL